MYFVGVIYGVDGQTTLFPAESEDFAFRLFNRLIDRPNGEVRKCGNRLAYHTYKDATTTRTDTIFIGQCKELIEDCVKIQKETKDYEARMRARNRILAGG